MREALLARQLLVAILAVGRADAAADLMAHLEEARAEKVPSSLALLLLPGSQGGLAPSVLLSNAPQLAWCLPPVPCQEESLARSLRATACRKENQVQGLRVEPMKMEVGQVVAAAVLVVPTNPATADLLAPAAP